MEREKERQRQQWEEKESNEAEEDRKRAGDADDEEEEEEEEDLENAVLVWQEDYGKDNLGLPIMHWEALSLHIAELEKQEEEKKAKSGASLERGSWTEQRRRAESWDDGDDNCSNHMIALSSRLQTQMNLQLCFINNSESEDDEKEGDVLVKDSSGTWSKRASVQAHKTPPPAAKPEKPKSGGLRNTLRNLRDRLRADHKSPAKACSDRLVERRHLERSDLNNFTIKELNALCSSLSQTIQDLSSELVGRLQVRDQLRTKQDALLLEVQDLTSV
ncbi:schwannomin-interacting protein 1 [Betta splendens]|uniref:Schwannomin-interacting protein 1 n=1 Tax=Betta splendens TaxID=158456 RepID=A0A6P7LRS7_BETSP|nr:schwannomin-interacting protein 1 [Betta splendens]XP_028996678.1 schwannomin-interacting protein 1 [Betta splendens]